MTLGTEYLERCTCTLESALRFLHAAPPESIEYEIYRNAVVKGFELTLETAGKLLRRALKSYGAAPKSVDALFYKDVFRHAALHGLLDEEAVARWFRYRDNRNDTAHDYGEAFARQTLALLPEFIADANALSVVLQERFRG